MAGHSISGATDYVIICTGGCSVVSDKSLSQPVSAFGFTPTRVPVMSDASHVPNIFMVLVMRINPLRPL